MIAIVSSSGRERAAFVSLLEARGWPAAACDSVRAVASLVRRTPPSVVLVRQRLSDGYSDDVIELLGRAGLLPNAKIIALLAAGTGSIIEARQLSLGADCVQRDPVHTDVLIEYVRKYWGAAGRPTATPHRRGGDAVPFAGGTLHVATRQLENDGQLVRLTAREVQLAEFLAHSQGRVATYETLYSEILGQRFRGQTSNMRVLLGKLRASAQRVGIDLTCWVEVISKSGYRYPTPDPPAPSRTKNTER